MRLNQVDRPRRHAHRPAEHADAAAPAAAGGAMTQRVGGGGPGGGDGPQMVVMEGSNQRYRLDLFLNVQNLFNHINYNAFVGNQQSEFFGRRRRPARRAVSRSARRSRF